MITQSLIETPLLGFNPAEAREWFKSMANGYMSNPAETVSIQPKQENGLRVENKQRWVFDSEFQSSRSKRMV